MGRPGAYPRGPIPGVGGASGSNLQLCAAHARRSFFAGFYLQNLKERQGLTFRTVSWWWVLHTGGVHGRERERRISGNVGDDRK